MDACKQCIIWRAPTGCVHGVGDSISVATEGAGRLGKVGTAAASVLIRFSRQSYLLCMAVGSFNCIGWVVKLNGPVVRPFVLLMGYCFEGLLGSACEPLNGLLCAVGSAGIWPILWAADGLLHAPKWLPCCW